MKLQHSEVNGTISQEWKHINKHGCGKNNGEQRPDVFPEHELNVPKMLISRISLLFVFLLSGYRRFSLDILCALGLCETTGQEYFILEELNCAHVTDAQENHIHSKGLSIVNNCISKSLALKH